MPSEKYKSPHTQQLQKVPLFQEIGAQTLFSHHSQYSCYFALGITAQTSGFSTAARRSWSYPKVSYRSIKTWCHAFAPKCFLGEIPSWQHHALQTHPPKQSAKRWKHGWCVCYIIKLLVWWLYKEKVLQRVGFSPHLTSVRKSPLLKVTHI